MIDLQVRGDDRGSLIAIEAGREAPFSIERVYYLFGTVAGVERGFHAHKRLQQLAVAVRGSCLMLLDDGVTKETVRLDDPAKGLLIGPDVWRQMSEFSADCVLMVLADAPYDESDYIRDYDAFLRHIGR